MRYVIGCKIENKDHSIIEGIIMNSSIGLPCICSWDKMNKDNKYIFSNTFVIFDNIEECQKEITNLSKAYKQEFKEKIKKYNLNPENFKFFALRFDTPKFNKIKIKLDGTHIGKKFYRIIKI